MNQELMSQVMAILENYSAVCPDETAQTLKKLWLGFEPNQGIELIKAEQRAQYEAAGTPIPVLKEIGERLAKAAREDVRGFLPLARLLWDEYGREGRVVALIMLGAMELVEPENLVPLIKEMCRGCVSWEDADRLAMDALEPVVRKYPERWLVEMGAWLEDENKWVRRAGITVIARLPMKHPDYTARCLDYTVRLLFDPELDVKRAVSFAIRICAKVDPTMTLDFLQKQVPAASFAAVWVLCDVIKSMDKKIVGSFSALLPLYQKWYEAPGISAKDQRSLESAVKVWQDK
jgi:3-methyladenine DNA glycosylase AlkD